MTKKEPDLEKGLGKLLQTAALAGTMAAAQVGANKNLEKLPPKNPPVHFTATELKPEPGYDKPALQRAMARVESNEGQNTNHDLLTAGPDAGTRAKGQYGFTNSTIKDVIKNSPAFKKTHGHVLQYDDDQMHNLIYNEQPHLQHHLASEQIDNIARALNTKKPEHVAYAWLNGISGTQKALQSGKDINGHWHVQKVMKAYNDILNKQIKKNHNDIVAELKKKEVTPPGLYCKNPPERSREMSIEIQKILGDQWKKAREALNEDDSMDSTKPNPLADWNSDLDPIKNNDSNVFIINLIKSKI